MHKRARAFMNFAMLSCDKSKAKQSPARIRQRRGAQINRPLATEGCPRKCERWPSGGVTQFVAYNNNNDSSTLDALLFALAASAAQLIVRSQTVCARVRVRESLRDDNSIGLPAS